MQCPKIWWAACVCVLTLSLWPAQRAHAIENSDCFVCHSDLTLSKTNAAGKTVSLFIDEQKYAASIHAKNLCTSCHTDITDVPHAENLKPVSCSQCHRIETDIYLKSDHGQAIHQGVAEAASCRDCHGDALVNRL